MNKELIKKYKAEFDHWLNGGEIKYKHKNSVAWWTTDCWDYSPDYVQAIIINDEFVEFRKALAEGKTIQYNFGNHGSFKQDFPNTWKDIDLSIGILSDRAHPSNYRIKPEEPRFKVGDWVRTADGTVIKLDWVDKPGVLSHLYDYGIFGKDNCKVSYQNEAIKWHPEPREWCWCPVFGLVKVLCETTENGNHCYLCWNPWKKAEQKLYNLEPFIGELPSYLKD